MQPFFFEDKDDGRGTILKIALLITLEKVFVLVGLDDAADSEGSDLYKKTGTEVFEFEQ